MIQTEHLSESNCFPTLNIRCSFWDRRIQTSSFIPPLPARLSSSCPPFSNPVFPSEPKWGVHNKMSIPVLSFRILGWIPPQACSWFILSSCIFSSVHFFFPSLSKFFFVHLLIYSIRLILTHYVQGYMPDSGTPCEPQFNTKLPSVLCPKLLSGQAFGSMVRPVGSLCKTSAPVIAHLYCLKDL